MSNRKDKYGEVFTPPILIQELLDHLPKYVWTDSNAQWLDPCAGQGNFLDEILPRLMDGLSTKIPNSTTRRRHILERMITQIEFNPANVRVLRSKYGTKTKIISADFLSTTHNNTYDVIVANPPYQSPKNNAYKGSSGKRTLWDLFVKRALELATPNTGVLGFITPANWRRPDHELWLLLRERLLFLHIYGKAAGMEFFHVQTRFDIYVFQQKPNEKETKIPLVIDEQGISHSHEIVTKQWPFMPNGLYKIIQSILVPKEEGIQVIYDSTRYDARKLTLKPTASSKYPIVHTLNQQGIGLRYASERDTVEGLRPSKQFVPKVILNVNEKQYPVNDWQGKYGMSQLSFGIPIRSKTEGERLVACINSPLFQDIIRMTKWGSFQTDYRMFGYFRPDFCKIIHQQLTSEVTLSPEKFGQRASVPYSLQQLNSKVTLSPENFDRSTKKNKLSNYTKKHNVTRRNL